MMSLRNLMEDKKLDFYQPLLSVRRFSSTATSFEANNERLRIEQPKIPPLPVYKSELKSGPVRNPGTVPFIWEHTPGKPKDESKTKSQLSLRPPLAPKLPPGRVHNIKQEVPLSVNASSDVIDKEIEEEKVSSGSWNDEEEGEGDEVYRDAMDRFSRSESFFMNCSISGISGLDGSEIKHSEAFLTDPQTRDFMMDRFLPAAKAMASETPPHAIRKPAVTIERPREVKMVTNGIRQRQPNPYVQTQHVKELCGEESEEEDDDDDFDRSGYSSARGCGFLPRFCLKGSLVLLNPVPGMRMQANSVSSVRRNRNSSTGTSRDAVSEKRSSHGQGMNRLQLEENVSKFNESSGKSYIQESDTIHRHLQGKGISNYQNEPPLTVNEATKSGANEHGPCRRSQISFQELLDNELGLESPVIEKTLYIDSMHKIRSPTLSSNSSDMNGIGNFSADIVDDASVKSAEAKELYPLDSATQDIKKLNAVDKKTLVGPNSLESVDSCSPHSPGRSFCEVKMDSNCSRFNQEYIQKATKMTSSQFSYNKKFDLESQFPLKSSNRSGSDDLIYNTIGLTGLDGTGSEKVDLDRKQPEKSSHECNDVTFQENSKKLESDGRRVKEIGSQENFHGLAPYSLDLRTSKTAANEKIDPKNQFLVRESNKDNSHGCYSQLPFAPPPPKSPSESWLKRTLPTSSRNSSFLRSSLAMQKTSLSLTTSPNLMWESTVKRSNTSHQNLQCSQELLSSIPEV